MWPGPGSSTHTYVTFRQYLAYCQQQRDDGPLYLFEPEFVDNYPELEQAYVVPSYFEKGPLVGWVG